MKVRGWHGHHRSFLMMPTAGKIEVSLFEKGGWHVDDVMESDGGTFNQDVGIKVVMYRGNRIFCIERIVTGICAAQFRDKWLPGLSCDLNVVVYISPGKGSA